MIRELTIDYVGPSEDDRAHLRLLMRKVADSMAVRWHWGEEHRADALFIDPTTLAGQMARTRAQEGGVRCILLERVASTGANEQVLPRPFRAEAMRAALDAVAAQRDAASSAQQALGQQTVLALEPTLPDALAPWRPPSPRSLSLPEPTHEDAEALFRRMPSPSRLTPPSVASGLAQATLAPTESPTARSQLRGAPAADAPLRSSAAPLRVQGKDSPVPLRDYLVGELLGGPSRITADGLPALALDPKEHAFHSAAPLAALLPWLLIPVRAGDWQALTNGQLRQLREAQPARDYQQLHWLDRLQQAGGQLPRHLDPGGTYRLSAPFTVAPDFPAQQRIVRALASPIRLHELAAAAAVRMGDVFDAVAALDAIGLIECRPRERLQRGPASPAPPSGASGLLARALASITLPRSGH